MLNCEDLEFSLKGVSVAVCDKIRCLAKEIEVVVTQPYNVRSAPDFTYLVRVLA